MKSYRKELHLIETGFGLKIAACIITAGYLTEAI
jgi:hypothetical protein